MRNNIMLGILMLFFGGCIKPYEPVFNDDSIEKWVIEGSISNNEGWQEVRISKSSNYQNASFLPVNNCQVKIIDDLGQEFSLQNFEDGSYRVWVASDYLVSGRNYHINVKTPDGNEFKSKPDMMPFPTKINDAYYEIEDISTFDPEVFIRGLKFYIDLNANNEDNEYFRWRITETWEIKSAYPKEFWYDGEIHQYIPPDSSTFYCWITKEYPEIFTLSTSNLDQNLVTNIPLQFVSSQTEKLAILYSFLVEQIALSQGAYNYWRELKKNIDVGEGLYASQPLAIQGNVYNLNDVEESVLGYFSAISISDKRYFIEPIQGLELLFSDKCSPAVLRKGLVEIRPWEYPAYLMSDGGQWIPYILNNECVDCRLRGGVPEKPEFWP